MAYDTRNLAAYAAIGILIATSIILAVQLTPLPFIPTANTGVLVIKLTDAPVDLEDLYVNISSIEAHRVGDHNDQWIELLFVNGTSWVYIDILELQNVVINLSITEVPVGNYTKLRMFITSANATFQNGDEVPLKVPSGKIDVIVHFEVRAGETTEVLIDMQADWVAISHAHTLRPVLKATVS